MNHIFNIFDAQFYDCWSCPKCGIGSWKNIEDLLTHSAWKKKFDSNFVLNNFYNSLKDPNLINIHKMLPKTFHQNDVNCPPIAHNNIIYLISNQFPNPGAVTSVLDCDLSDEDWLVKNIIT